MVRYRALIIMVAVIVLVLASCAGMQKPPSEGEAYYTARTLLNDYWENYLDYRDAIPAGPVKDELRAKFKDTGTDSVFTRAKKALDAWGVSLGTGDAASKQRMFNVVFDEITKLLMQENILKVE